MTLTYIFHSGFVLETGKVHPDIRLLVGREWHCATVPEEG